MPASPDIQSRTSDLRGPKHFLFSPVRAFSIYLIVLAVLFLRPLFNLFSFSFQTALYSHIALIPFITLYLIRLKRTQLPPGTRSFSLLVCVPLFIGLLALVVGWVFDGRTRPLSFVDDLSLSIFSFVCFVLAGVAWLWGAARTRALAFPLCFLFFIVPFPTIITQSLETFLQHASADAASLMIALSSIPVLREGLAFKLPGIVIEVGHECSGIRSSLVLFITSLLGGYMFFHFARHRAILALAVLPLAILRNGFRIFTIALLCVRVDRDMINSLIHRRGGPLFFILSLVPFFALLLWLYRREQRLRPEPAPSRADQTTNS
jgi:exosortase C (VPDSG-CTERM-specific)